MDITTKIILTEAQDIDKYKQKSECIATLGYQGLSIEIFALKAGAPNSDFLINAKGLGHEFHIHYLFDPDNRDIITPLDLVQEVFKDFKDYIIYEREESRPSVH